MCDHCRVTVSIIYRNYSFVPPGIRGQDGAVQGHSTAPTGARTARRMSSAQLPCWQSLITATGKHKSTNRCGTVGLSVMR